MFLYALLSFLKGSILYTHFCTLPFSIGSYTPWGFALLTHRNLPHSFLYQPNTPMSERIPVYLTTLIYLDLDLDK
jgi:hypothetical protein